MNRSDDNRNSARSMFGSVFNSAKGMVEDRARQVRDSQEVSQLLSRLGDLERDLTFQVKQLFFADSFGKSSNPSQKEPFVYRRCQEYRKTAAVNQSDRDELLRKIVEIRNNRSNSYEYAEDLRALIAEIESYKLMLANNNKRIELNNISDKKLAYLQDALNAALKSQRILPRDADRIIVPVQKDQSLDSVFLSRTSPIMVRMKNTYYLYPDFVLVVNNNKCIIDILSPAEFHMSVSDKQYVGVYDIYKHSYPVSSRIGTDSRIIKEGPEIKHYEHEKKDGKPDTRYKENNVISRTRENLGEVGVLSISVLNDKTEIEFSSSQAASKLEMAVKDYCVGRDSASLSGLRLLDLLISVDDDNREIQELYSRYSQYLDEKNPVCRIISLRGA